MLIPTFTRDKVFSNAQTGNVVLMSQEFMAGNFIGGIKYLLPFLAFGLGVLVTEQINARYKMAKRIHWRQLIILIEIAILAIVGFIPHSLNMAATVLVSFSCAMQVQAFRKVNGSAYASTMCIGNLRSGVDAFCAYWDTRDRTALRKAGRYFAVILILPWGRIRRRCLPALGNRGHLGQLSAAGRQFSSDVPAGDPGGSGLLRMRGTASIRISHQ